MMGERGASGVIDADFTSRCSFCGHADSKLTIGPTVSICADCVAIAAKHNSEAEVLPADGTRAGSLKVSRDLMKQVRVPPGYRVVIVATDESGSFTGVHTNTDPEDTHALLVSAVRGVGREDAPRDEDAEQV